MIPVGRVPEPPGFHDKVRQPGRQWLLRHPQAERPRDLWSPFREKLAEGFGHRCGYTAMWELSGTVDHFRSIKRDRSLAYEWSNYRYASQWINSSKRAGEVLDPYDVGEGWFEVHLPSLQLLLTDKVPEVLRALVESTLRLLPLVHDERILRLRRAWYAQYQAGRLSLEGLRVVAPLIASAIERSRERAQT
ncbi:hypothetical protein [Archangium primigenium]|uniref:hypothetical protein n=1 Tax=[Archangium] primigenium TaxID=2792470 RepID=UPI00195B98EA|nr:hypothetical protein [Archangium primigenium]MBM7112640.1 hypothetical protein [Archangium primigenium]